MNELGCVVSRPESMLEELMRKHNRAVLWLALVATISGVVVLPGCGGGGGGGGSDELPNFLALAGGVFFGTRDGGVVSISPFPTVPPTGVPMPPGGTATVNGAVFPSGTSTRQDFLQLSFNVPVKASTVSGSQGGVSGIVVTRTENIGGGATASTVQPFRLDAAGVVDPANAITGDVAPSLLRLYYDPDGDLTTSQPIPAGAYVVSINPALQTFNGGPFCVNNAGGNCVVGNTYLPTMSFTIGSDMSDLTMAGNVQTGAGASNITQGDTNVPIDREIHLNFSKAVAFDALVGGAANLTTLDPFVTIPFPIAATFCAGSPSSFNVDVGSLHFMYTAPVDSVTGAIDPPGVNLGLIVYMPDPILNPTHVRVRFVDVSSLQGVDAPLTSTYQNYASNPTKLPIPSSDPALNGALLTLPPTNPVPGSGQNYSPSVGFTDPERLEFSVVVESTMFGDPTGLGCSIGAGSAMDRNNIDPTTVPPTTITPNGFTFNSTTADYFLRFNFASGPLLARNPAVPDATFVARRQGAPGLSCVNTASIVTELNGPGTGTWVPQSSGIAAGMTVTGTMLLAPNPLSDPSILAEPADMEIGQWVIYQQVGAVVANNTVSNPGRGVTNIPGTPDVQGGTTPIGLQTIINNPMFPPPSQPWGSFLYVVDATANSVKVFNSYDFTLITSLVGIASPAGLGITPNLNTLYVSNFNVGTITAIDANPVSPNFHNIQNVIQVGPGPTGITVQPANEDIFVLNYADNSFSVVDRPTGVERTRLSNGGIIGPTDCFATGRMAGMGLTNAYTAYITGRFSNTLAIYESDSPSVPENTMNGVVKQTLSGRSGPTYGCWNWQSYIAGSTGPGCFVANSTGTTVDEVILQNFTLSPPPGFPGNPGMRDYITAKQFQTTAVPGLNSQNPSDASIDAMSGLPVAAAPNAAGNNKGLADPSAGGGIPSVVLVSYPSAGVVAAFDYASPFVHGTVSVPGCDFMHAYYDQ